MRNGSKSTITDLPNAIRDAVPNSGDMPAVMEIIKEAEAGEFHDFKNNKYVCGKQQVVAMLRATNIPALENIISDVMNGVYDESPDAADKAAMKKDWLENGETLESYKAMFGED